MELKDAGLSRRSVLRGAALLAGLGATATVLNACTGGEPSTSSSKKFNGTTLQISAVDQYYANAIKMFEKPIYDQFGVKLSFTISTTDASYTNDILAFKSRRAPADIVLYEPTSLRDFQPYLTPINQLASKYHVDFQLDDVYPLFKAMGSWGGAQYGMPFAGDQHDFYYNKDAFSSSANKAGFHSQFGYALTPPETWDQYADIAKYFGTHSWGGASNAGTGEAWRQNSFSYWWWEDRFSAYGGVWFDEKLKPLINSRSGVRALENMLAVQPYVPKGTLSYGFPELNSALLKGEVPMCVQWSSTGEDAMQPSQSSVVGKIGASVVPGVKAADGSIHRGPGVGGWQAGVPKFSNNEAAAATVLAYISGPARALRMCTTPATQVTPWRKSSLESVAPWAAVLGNNDAYAQEYVTALKDTLETGFWELSIAGTSAYRTALDSQLQLALTGAKSPAEALSDAATSWNEISKRYGMSQQIKDWNSQYAEMKSFGIKYQPELAA